MGATPKEYVANSLRVFYLVEAIESVLLGSLPMFLYVMLTHTRITSTLVCYSALSIIQQCGTTFEILAE
jgi:hypothetical protein